MWEMMARAVGNRERGTHSPSPIRLKPGHDNRRQVDECQTVGFQPGLVAYPGQVHLKPSIVLNDLAAAGKPRTFRCRLKPIPHRADCARRFSPVRVNVLSRDVGDKLLVAVLIGVQNQSAFPALALRSIPLATQEQSKLQRHVEAGQSGCDVQRHGRKVVYSEAALLNDSFNLGEPELGCILFLYGAASDEAQVIDDENNGVENRPGAGIEGA